MIRYIIILYKNIYLLLDYNIGNITGRISQL